MKTSPHIQSDAVQWAITQLNSSKGHAERTQEERHYLHELENLRRQLQGINYRSYDRPA